MLYNAVEWFWNRYRPAEGWLSLFLLFAAIVCLTAAITSAGWVPEDGVVTVTGAWGLFLGVVVAKGRLRPFAAWLLILNYGLVINAIYLGQLLPPLSALIDGRGATVFRQQWFLLFDRLAGWWIAVSQGGSSTETLPFALGLGLLIWLLSAYAAWSTYRQRRPLVALTLIALALALNGYFSAGEVPTWFTALFIALAVMLTAAMHFANMEQVWIEQAVDYSREIRFELLAVATAVAVVLLTISLFLPAFRVSALARAFQESAPVEQAEDTLSRVFAGVRRPRREVVAGPGGAGVMPRSYLLGNAPELYETVVFTATVQGDRDAHPGYWRGLTYDIYTGRGWALSEERSEVLEAGETLPLQGQRIVTQTVFRRFADPQVRYTLGYPQSFADAVNVFWRGADDFSRASGPGAVYTATSTLLSATGAELRQAATAPEVIRARYTSLPQEVPTRVVELAQEITAAHNNDYDRARALETFLRQYPYSLEVAPPPPDRDPVDFFLFDLQSGYCDYYASAMVVMARSIGLPSRMVIGYLAQQPDERGLQTVYQINAHAWVEVYFHDIGWVEFEPTAAFATRTEVVEGDPLAIDSATPELPAVPLPEPDLQRRFPPWLALLLMVAIVAAWVWWLRRPRRAQPQATRDTLLWAYARVQQNARRLGQPTPPSQTPAEFGNALTSRLANWQSHRYLGRLLDGVQPAIGRLTALFALRQYGRRSEVPERAVGSHREWREILRRLWLFSYLKRLFERNN